MTVTPKHKFVIEWIKALTSGFLGVLCFVMPFKISGVLGLLFGLFLAIAGVIRVATYFMYGKHVAGAYITLFEAAVMIVLGILFIRFPQLFLTLLTRIIGLYFIVDGFSKYSQTLLNRKEHKLSVREKIRAVLQVVIIVLGLAILLMPFLGTRMLMLICGVSLIVTGAQTIVEMSEKRQ